MRYITEQELRDAFASGVPERYTLPENTKLTPAARQYLADLRLLPPEPLARRALVSAGGKKPEDHTHLSAKELVRKDHPRIALRGKLDLLEADILLAQVVAERLHAPAFSQKLGDALALTRRILAADYKNAPLGPWTLDGMDETQVHEASHHPERYGVKGHILPDTSQGELAALINRLRAFTRETEVLAVSAYATEGKNGHEDLVLALNRLSSYLYVLQLQAVSF